MLTLIFLPNLGMGGSPTETTSDPKVTLMTMKRTFLVKTQKRTFVVNADRC